MMAGHSTELVTAAQAISDRETAGGAAPDNVLRSASLQDDRVDHHVEEDRGQPEPGRQRVGAEPQDRDGGGAQQPGEDQRLARRHLAGDQGPVLRAVHQFVDVAVDVAVEGAGAAGREGAAHQRGQDQADGREAPLGVDHGGQRTDQQQLDDTGLGEGEIRLGLTGEPGSPCGAGSVQRRICCAHGGSHPFCVGSSVWQCSLFAAGCPGCRRMNQRWFPAVPEDRRNLRRGAVTRRRPPNIIPCALVTDAPLNRP